MNDQPQVQCQVTIGASVSTVWAIVQDSTLLPQWMPNVDHTVITTEQRRGVGEVRSCQVSMTGRKGQLVEECVEFTPLQKISFQVQEESFGFSRIIAALGYSLHLQPISTEQTQVQLEYHYRAKGVLGHLLNRFLIKPQWQPLCLDMLSGLKTFSEQPSV